MCGFTGTVSTNPLTAEDLRAVAGSTRLLAHRGPDDGGNWHDDHAALGFRRLSVQDPSAAGHQPMRSADGRYWIAFNGEIYNVAELAARVPGRRSRCDTEILLELFVQLGPAVVGELRGMFAFAVWDTVARTVFLGRDPFGIKPLCYSFADGMLRFASEKKALAAPVDPDPTSLRRFLTLQYVPAPDTMSPDVRVLPAGHALTFRPGGTPEITRYWEPVLRPSRKPTPRAEILETLADSVAAHLRSDVPVGAFLSGGIDSAAICALAAQLRPDLQTFTVGFEREGYSEIERALETAEALGVKTNPYVITPTEFAANLPRIMWQLDEPFGDAAAIALWFLAREARKQVTVVLSGEGADELFGGYHVYRCADGDYLGADQVYAPSEVDGVAVVAGGSALDVVAPVRRRAMELGLDDVAGKQLVDLNLWLPGDILTKADRMTMAHGLELRVPFLDRSVFRVAAGLSRADKIGADTTKVALRQAVRGLVPDAVAERAKLGFPVPIRFWLRDELHDFADGVLREAETDRYIDRSTALDLLARYRRGEDFDWRRIWVLVCFSLWHQVHIEGRYPVPA